MPIILPNDWAPAAHQRALWRYLDAGGKRAVAVWHRRAGKDSVALNWAAVAAHLRKGIYWHMLPEIAQGRKVVWNGIDREGRRMIDQAFPRSLRLGIHKQDMRIELKCGSIWQVVGSDNYNSLIGSNPVGVVFSEFAVADPMAWDYLRPILAENNGWAMFIYTPRGRNHGAHLFETARNHKDWFAQILTVEHTGIIPSSRIEEERRSGMPDEMIRQEYFCSFQAAMLGAYYGALMEAAEAAGRIRKVPYDPNLPVRTAWDLGIGDSTAIWFCQLAGQELRLIDYYENSGLGLDHYAKILYERGYRYGEHILPHDAQARELGTGKSRLEVLERHGIRARILPIHKLEDGISAVRVVLGSSWFDAEKCKRGIEALRQYRQEWDDRRKNFSDRPRHDWTSHACDAFRYLALGLRTHQYGYWNSGSQKEASYDPFHW